MSLNNDINRPFAPLGLALLFFGIRFASGRPHVSASAGGGDGFAMVKKWWFTGGLMVV